MKKQIYIFLTLRLLKRQRLRTAAIFCGMLFSVYLLCAFAGFGYEFWRQVHPGTDADTEFDATEGILILLVAAVLLLVVTCAAVLLANLFSLTFSQRWKSLSRLVSLGADTKGLFVMTFLEVLLLFGAAAPVGFVLARLTVNVIGVQYEAPLWMDGVSLAIVFLISCMYARKPLSCVRRSSSISMGKEGNSHDLLHAAGDLISVEERAGRHVRVDICCLPRRLNFSRWKRLSMHPDEVRMGKRRRLRVAVTLFTAILLYVPADYVIGTNLAVHRSELHMKYGISYSASPQNWRELEEAVDECGRLAACNAGGDTMSYALLSVSAEVKTNAMSRELLGVLKKAGWVEQPVFSAQGTICFLEDQAYEAYVRACGGGADVASVLVNRYVNRGAWKEQAKPSFREAKVLERADGGGQDAVTFFPAKNEENSHACMEHGYLTCRVDDEFSPVSTSRMTPEWIADVPPDGMDFDGSLTLVIPLSELEAVCLGGAYVRRMQVYGKFEDSGENGFSLFFMPELPDAGYSAGSDVFSALEACLGEHSVGSLHNTREVFQEWYASMHGLHLAMRAISGLLFFMAVLNLFSMMIFQYMERRRGLAIRWSLGESPRGLLKFLVGEHLRGFCGALVAAAAVSAVLCRVIYGIFQSVWQIDFVFPGRQIGVALAMVLLVSLLAVLVDGYFIRHQRFLEDIRRTEW